MPDFKKGDKVRIVEGGGEARLRNSTDFDNLWTREMEKQVNDGKIYRVVEATKYGVALALDSGLFGVNRWPPAMLSLVEGPQPFAVGDKVRVTHVVKTVIWVDALVPYVNNGTVYTVRAITPHRYGWFVHLNKPDGSNVGWSFPAESLRYADEVRTSDTHPTTEEGEPTMLQIQDRVFVNGADITTKSDDQLIEMIQQAEVEAKKLKEMETVSTTIAERIAVLDAGRRRLAKELDARHAPKAEVPVEPAA